MKTIAEIEATLKPGMQAYYAARCCWWTTDPAHLGSIDGTADGLPCCPYCGSVLFQCDAAKLIADAREYASYYKGGADYAGGLVSFALSHHVNGRHGLVFDKLEPVIPELKKFRRPNRTLSTEKSARCVRCRSEFSEAETAGYRGCPTCGSTGLPMPLSHDVTVKVNWHELRILTMWAERWADAVEKSVAQEGGQSDAKAAVTAIARALESQHPTLPPLTLLGELKQVQESYPELETRDGEGNVILPAKKAN